MPQYIMDDLLQGLAIDRVRSHFIKVILEHPSFLRIIVRMVSCCISFRIINHSCTQTACLDTLFELEVEPSLHPEQEQSHEIFAFIFSQASSYRPYVLVTLEGKHSLKGLYHEI